MGKDKKRSADETKKEETLFYYELIGMIFIVFSITTLGQLGKIGFFLTVFFKVVFGDWYWIVVLFLLFYGFLSLLRHKSFDFKNQRFIGFLFFCFGLLIFSHFPLHNYISETNKDYFASTWAIYRAYLNNQIDTYLGGGLLGAMVFYVIFYLFGTVGVVLIGMLIMMLGLSLIINMPMIDMITTAGKKIRGLTKLTGNFNRFFRYELGKTLSKHNEAKNIFIKSQQVPLKILEEYQNVMNYNFQEKLAIETRSLIHSVFNNLNIEYRDIDFTISFKVTTFKFVIFSDYETKTLMDRLNNVIEEEILLGKDNNNLIIQIVNKYPQILTMRELLMKQSSLYNNYLLPLGLTYENKMIDLDVSKGGNLLLIGSKDSGVKNFVSYFVFGLFVKENLINYEMELYDNSKDLHHFHDLLKLASEDDVNDFLNRIISDIDQRLEAINKGGVTSYDEFNKKLEIDGDDSGKLKRRFIIINNLGCDKETYSYFENKLMYVTQLGEKAGYTVVYIIREELYITSIILSLFIHKLIFKVDTSYFSQKIMNNENAHYLQNSGDCFYLSQVKARRLQTPLVSKKDISSIKEFLK